jgi:hypothetical protein
MDSKNATIKVFPGQSKEKRPYGKAPLELDLPQALEAVGKISQEGKSMPESELALVLGNTITSSAFTRKVRSLSAYGLLMDQTGGQFTLTDLALAIALPRSPLALAAAKKQAFLKIEQFAFLFNQHKGKLLPADEFLRNILEQECAIPREVSQEWVKQFKDGARTAGLFHNRGDGKIQIAESPMSSTEAIPLLPPQPSERSDDAIRFDGDGSHSLAEARATEPPQQSMIAASGHCTRIELSDGRRAEISIPDRLTARDAQKLQKALDGVRVIIESMIVSET